MGYDPDPLPMGCGLMFYVSVFMVLVFLAALNIIGVPAGFAVLALWAASMLVIIAVDKDLRLAALGIVALGIAVGAVVILSQLMATAWAIIAQLN